jgi:outer membrane protein assembly factor BamE (lipoprotein component of BamABCDE complex)
MKGSISIAVVLVLIAGCTASAHRDQVRDDEGDRLTVGTVQREIRRGMSGAEVIAALGSPNIVSTDENGLEVFVWDKFSTERVHSDSTTGIWIFGAGVGGDSGGAGSIGGSSSSGASSTAQRTLTVIVKFDEQNKVRDVAYHATRF